MSENELLKWKGLINPLKQNRKTGKLSRSKSVNSASESGSKTINDYFKSEQLQTQCFQSWDDIDAPKLTLQQKLMQAKINRERSKSYMCETQQHSELEISDQNESSSSLSSISKSSPYWNKLDNINSSKFANSSTISFQKNRYASKEKCSTITKHISVNPRGSEKWSKIKFQEYQEMNIKSAENIVSDLVGQAQYHVSFKNHFSQVFDLAKSDWRVNLELLKHKINSVLRLVKLKIKILKSSKRRIKIGGGSKIPKNQTEKTIEWSNEIDDHSELFDSHYLSKLNQRLNSAIALLSEDACSAKNGLKCDDQDESRQETRKSDFIDIYIDDPMELKFYISGISKHSLKFSSLDS